MISVEKNYYYEENHIFDPYFLLKADIHSHCESVCPHLFPPQCTSALPIVQNKAECFVGQIGLLLFLERSYLTTLPITLTHQIGEFISYEHLSMIKV